MIKKQTMRNVMAGLLLLLGMTVILSPVSAFAAKDPVSGCETPTAIIKCDNVDVGAGGVENTGLWSILITVINILTAGVGVVALAGIVYGSILYTSAGGNQEQVKKAMGIFTNVVVGIIAFAGMWALLNFLVPGGVF
jgi:hypothetical protein